MKIGILCGNKAQEKLRPVSNMSAVTDESIIKKKNANTDVRWVFLRGRKVRRYQSS